MTHHVREYETTHLLDIFWITKARFFHLTGPGAGFARQTSHSEVLRASLKTTIPIVQLQLYSQMLACD